jgi:disulfide bond formation protein DsbB
MKRVTDKITKTQILYIVWFISIISMLGSLYFSEIARYWPCTLCWYQRIAVYPLVFMIPVALIKKDWNVYLYILPLNIIGTIISVFHNMIYYNLIPETTGPCTLGISCTTQYIEWLGFITIPNLALMAFMAINLLMVFYIKKK